MNLVVECYNLAKQFPSNEVYGLTSQLQRAAVTVPANIAEGQGRLHKAEFSHFLSIARGSLTELETHIQIAHRLSYITENQAKQLLDKTAEVGRLLNGLLRFLKNKN